MRSLEPPEEFLVEEVAERFTSPGMDPQLRQATKIAMLAVHRWGEDLERGAGAQRYPAFEAVLDEAVETVAASEGRMVLREGVPLREAAEFVLDVVEEEGHVDRHEPGGLVEEVER